jgi:hypothetical protein
MKHDKSARKVQYRADKKCNTKSGRSPSRDTVDFWRKRIFRSAHQEYQSPNFSVQIQCHGRRQSISLGTSDAELAAHKAKQFYITVRAIGWAQALGELQPEKFQKKSEQTVGEFLDELSQKADIDQKTLESYARAFRTILSQAFNIDHKGKHAFGNAGVSTWRKRIHSIRLSDVTPEKIQAWKRKFLARAGDDPLKLRSAKVSVNSFLRRAKCLFSEKLIRHCQIDLPTPLPFTGINFEKKQNVRYRSGFDVFALLAKSRSELAVKDPECFKILLLALTAGLRAHEIDVLEWDAFDFTAGTLTVRPTRFFQPKSEYSLGTIDLEPEVVEVFHGFRTRARSNFVIESSLLPKPYLRYDYYRCRAHFDRLYHWLRWNGVNDRKPLHTLRKEFGSAICDRHGIYAASCALRHASVTVTASHYLDKKSRTTPGLGAALSNNIIELSSSRSG